MITNNNHYALIVVSLGTASVLSTERIFECDHHIEKGQQQD